MRITRSGYGYERVVLGSVETGKLHKWFRQWNEKPVSFGMLLAVGGRAERHEQLGKKTIVDICITKAISFWGTYAKMVCTPFPLLLISYSGWPDPPLLLKACSKSA